MAHRYEPEESDVIIHNDHGNVIVWCDDNMVTLSDITSTMCMGYVHLSPSEAVDAARAILNHFGEGVD